MVYERSRSRPTVRFANAPIQRLKGRSKLSSFDLKAATDSLPMLLTTTMVDRFFGEKFAYSWMTLMVQSHFRVPKPMRDLGAERRSLAKIK